MSENANNIFSKIIIVLCLLSVTGLRYQEILRQCHYGYSNIENLLPYGIIAGIGLGIKGEQIVNIIRNIFLKKE